MLIYNAIRTPDGTIIESTHRHDYVTHFDTLKNRKYVIDGGLDYCRRSNWGDEEVLSIDYESATPEMRSSLLKWGTRGPLGDQPLKRISIMSMDTDHIEMCLLTQSHMRPEYRETMEWELDHRGVDREY